MRFHPPARRTKVKFFREIAAMRFHEAWIVLDGGVPGGENLRGRGVFRVAGGEGCKRWGEVEKILAWLAEQKAERGHALAVVGGGATLDLGALAASLYRRGMKLVLVPTTLLGMVDATLGGKTAVDYAGPARLQKNFAGTFYPAHEVWVAPAFLATLPRRERLSGAGEVYKTLWLRGGRWNERALLDFVETGASGKLTPLIRECLAFKGKLVERDPLDEKRIREALNFGHTVGHALEAASGVMSHGECVLWGMAVETFLGKYPALPLPALELPREFREVASAEWAALLGADKKNRGGKIEMSLVARPGKIVRRKFTADQVVRAIKAFPESYRRGEERRRS